MAVAERMTVAEVVANVLAGEQGDFVREAVALVARELMEAEIIRSVLGMARSARRGRRIATAIGRGGGRRGSARSSC